MKTVKVKNIFLGLLAMVILSTMLVSCEQNALEDLTPNTEEQFQVEDRNSTLAADIIGTWRLSLEENTNPTVEHIYRPFGFSFPLVRGGRTGLRFSPNGNFIYLYTGPADQPLQATGTWRTFGQNNILITFPISAVGGTSLPRFAVINVVSVDSNGLVIKPLNW